LKCGKQVNYYQFGLFGGIPQSTAPSAMLGQKAPVPTTALLLSQKVRIGLFVKVTQATLKPWHVKTVCPLLPHSTAVWGIGHFR